MTDRLILIPTLGRGPEKQKTWDKLPRKVRGYTRLVVAKSEALAFTTAGLPVVICPQQGKTGLGAVRQWCVEYAVKNGATKLALLDDDLAHWARRGMSTTGDTYVVATEPQRLAAFERMWGHLDRYVHGAIAISLFAKGRPEVSYNTRALDALFFRVDVLIGGKHKFDMRTMSDFDMTLKLLRAGYANVVDRFCYQKQAGSNREGGCSGYRDLAEMERSARELARRYEGYVTLVERPSEHWAYERPRVDVRIAWARLAKDSNAGTVK